MSCQLTTLAHFHDILSVKRYLFPVSKDGTPAEEETDVSATWNDDWSWQDDDGSASAAPVDDHNPSWLQDVLLSLSPANDLMAIAHDNRVVLLRQEWDPEDREGDIDTKFTTVWHGCMNVVPGEIITAVLCLPLASQKRSTQGGPDWTCVILGFSSGFVRMYTETGTLLLSQLLHEEPVVILKAKTYEPQRYLGMAEQHEELVMLYQRAIVTIDGFSLFQSLRACRNQAARAAASGGDSVHQPPPLAYKKWSLQGQEQIMDHVSCGVHTSTAFDEMRNDSIKDGFSATIKPTSPAAILYATVGVGPYVGMFYAVEGSGQSVMADVAYAMAHKLKSALVSAATGWLGFGGKQKDDSRAKKPKIEPAVPLAIRSGLPDKRRQGNSIVLSPSSNYAATTDSFGRVILIDVERGMAIRMWKGYRDAQVGWIQVREEEHTTNASKGSPRVAQFLAIYAPRRGILEVWTAANGPRVAAFNVSKWGQLACANYGLMGLNNVTCRGVKIKAFQCALVDPDGVIKTLDVPFHLALSDKSSKRARDLHLLKKLKVILKDNSEESDTLETTVKSLLVDMKISSIAQQGLERVLHTKYLSASFMRNVLQGCIKQIGGKAEETLDIENRLMLQFCEIHDSLLNTYCLLQKLGSEEGDAPRNEDLVDSVGTVLTVTKKEAQHIVTQLELSDSLCTQDAVRVHFADNNTLSVSSFLSCFQCRLHRGDVEATGPTSVGIYNDLTAERRAALAHLFFHTSLASPSHGGITLVVQDSNINPDQLMSLLLSYWLAEDDKPLTAIPNLVHIIKAITAMTDKGEVLVDHSLPSPWWQSIRDVCSHSENNRAAFIAALAGRAVAMEMIANQTRAKDPDADTSDNPDATEDEWESLAVDIEQWKLHVKQMEDVTALDSLLKIQLPRARLNSHMEAPRASSEPQTSTTTEPITVSATKLLVGGKGVISEVVAKHIARVGYQSEMFKQAHILDETEEEMETEPAQEATEKMALTPQEAFIGRLEVLRQRFPHSLDNDVLLANCCWEYAVHWNKDPEAILHLDSSIQYLRLVHNAVLRQGVCSMLWHMFVLKRFSAAANLMEKVGKVPKERLCRKEVGISDLMMTPFVGLVCQLIDVTMEANCEASEVPVFIQEALWEMGHGPAPLVELAVDQKATNYGLLRHHYHLAILMHAVLVFNLKSIRVLSLFDAKGRNAFFQELHTHPLLPNQNIDTGISMIRRQFLSLVVTHAIRTLDCDMPTPSVSLSCSPTSTPFKHRNTVATLWPSLVLDLSKDFGLDVDFFKRHHMLELYRGGHDKLAEQVLLTVNDHEIMGSELLVLVGTRVAYYVLHRDQPDGCEALSDMPPALLSWLKTLETKALHCTDVPLKDTAVLIGHVVNQLPEGFVEYDRAINLVDLIQSLS